MKLEWLPILKEWVKNQFIKKTAGTELGVIKVSIDKDASI